jgi:hypothetical protein
VVVVDNEYETRKASVYGILIILSQFRHLSLTSFSLSLVTYNRFNHLCLSLVNTRLSSGDTAFSATMARGKNKKAAAANKPKGRPGPKSKFKGFRLQYMESILPTYLKHVSKGTTPSYWAVATAGYWARFNWRNSDLGVEVDEETFNNASVRPDVDGELSAEDEEKKSHIMARTNKVHNIAF